MKFKLTFFISLLFYAVIFSQCSEEDVEIDDHPIDQEEYNVYAGLFNEFVEDKIVLRSEPANQSIGRLNKAHAEGYGILNEYPQFTDLLNEAFDQHRDDSVLLENRFPAGSKEVTVVPDQELRDFFNNELNEGSKWEAFEELYGNKSYIVVSRILLDELKQTAVMEVITVAPGVVTGGFFVMEKKDGVWVLGMSVLVWQS